jgi:hypothetical protein
MPPFVSMKDGSWSSGVGAAGLGPSGGVVVASDGCCIDANGARVATIRAGPDVRPHARPNAQVEQRDEHAAEPRRLRREKARPEEWHPSGLAPRHAEEIAELVRRRIGAGSLVT